MGTVGSVSGVKPPGREADHSHLRPKLRISGVILLLPRKCTPLWCAQRQLYFIFTVLLSSTTASDAVHLSYLLARQDLLASTGVEQQT
jgi:hypothetical protein